MIRVKFRFGTANRKEMSWMSETSALMDTLRQEGVSLDLLRAVEEYRTAHPLAEALRPRIPSPAFVYYGREVWEQALAALLCGENLLLAGGKATGKNVLAENLAAAFGRPAWDISFHVNMDAASLIGMDTFEGGQVRFRPGPVYRCAQSGGFGVLDEINMAKKRGAGRPARGAGLPPRHRCAGLRAHPAGRGDPLHRHHELRLRRHP